jgi:hypothetical protein
MLPARSRSGDRTPFADTDFSKARGVHHYSRPSTPRSLESRAVAAIWDYCSTKSRSVVVPSSDSSKEERSVFNESSTSSVSNFWIHSQHERNRIELTPSTGVVKVVLYGDIRELISPKPSSEGVRIEVRIHAQPDSNQEHSKDLPEDAYKPLEGVCIMNECLRMVDFRKALKTAYRNSLVVSKIADALQDSHITQTADGTLWSHGLKDPHSPSKEGTRFRILPGDEVSVMGWNQDETISRILEGAPGSWQPGKKFRPHVVKVKVSGR